MKGKIKTTDVTINVKNIDDSEKCAAIISIMRAKKDNFQIFEYIKGLSDETITQFENYSKIYPSIIELDIDDDILDNSYNKIVKIITDVTLNI